MCIRDRLQSLLHVSGLDVEAYHTQFGSDAMQDFPQLAALISAGLAAQQAGTVTLTPAGLEQSDAIGPWLYSEAVNRLSGEYEWR